MLTSKGLTAGMVHHYTAAATGQLGEVVSVVGQLGMAGYLHGYSTEPGMKPGARQPIV